MKILGIETSCDETALALFNDEKLLYSKVSSHIIHKNYGGVVPELASREHDKILPELFKDCFRTVDISSNELDLIAVTQGPGLAGSLISGASFAKGLSLALNIPIIGINHLEAHIFANILSDPKLSFPFVCLLVSGGHTQLWYVKGLSKYKLLGETRDDAAGEAFDKGARILGLGYPGGPEIERCSKNGNPKKINFPRALMKESNLEFSFVRSFSAYSLLCSAQQCSALGAHMWHAVRWIGVHFLRSSVRAHLRAHSEVIRSPFGAHFRAPVGAHF